jgi:hypothetical protein
MILEASLEVNGRWSQIQFSGLNNPHLRHTTSNKMNVSSALSSSSSSPKSFLCLLLAEKSSQYYDTTAADEQPTMMQTSIVNDNAKAHVKNFVMDLSFTFSASSCEESWSDSKFDSFKREASLRSLLETSWCRAPSSSSLTDDDSLVVTTDAEREALPFWQKVNGGGIATDAARAKGGIACRAA